ncbi:MAG: flagellar hook-associated protein FlgL [Comamonas sp.]|nr:flagellar hook-associated protein FlgL [Candidatus Comamonas equi]
MSITRMGTANMYDRTINNISKQQTDLASQMEHASAGKRVLRPSDDPVAAAQAERARTRMTRVESDQRALDAQTATITYGESTLGEINDAVQAFRSLLVNAGNGAYNQTQRDTLVEQLQSLRSQILTYSNRKDSNDLPLFRGLDTKSGTPFPAGNQGIQSGQTNVSEYSITNSLDGALAFFSGKTGNGVAQIERDAGNVGLSYADVGTIKQPAEASDFGMPATDVTITFGRDAAGAVVYTIAGGAYAAPTTATYKSGDAIRVQGMDVVITGEPFGLDANGVEQFDSYTLSPSKSQSLFEVIDNTIATVRNNGKPDGSTDVGGLAHGISKALAELDTQLNRVSTVRGVAGDLLSQATRMGDTLQARSEQMETQRSTAEDIDMVAALSQLKTQETAVSAALQSYASIQKLSLFNYIN